MMFARTDEQRMLAESLDSALAAGAALDWNDAVGAPGLEALGVPENAGGMGTELRDAAVVAAAFGRANAGLPWAEHWTATKLGAPATMGPRAINASEVLRFANDQGQRADAKDDLALLHAAEMVGLCRTMLGDTAGYLKQRQQFGVAIASFQALRHRMADMAMALEQAEALVDLAIDADPGERAPMVSAARVLADECARIVGEGAVQLHGAMGLTSELRLGGYFRRLRVLMQGDDTAAAHVRRHAALSSTPRAIRSR
jgi:alkylation response protein AidB-like acyl-CoA dehydrogenase